MRTNATMRFPTVLALGNATETDPTAEPCTAFDCFRAIELDAPAPIVRTTVALPVPAELLALIVMLLTPAFAGVPLMRPVVALSTSPAGRPLAPKFAGLFVAVIW